MKKLQNLSLSGGLSNSTDFGLCSHTKQNAFYLCPLHTTRVCGRLTARALQVSLACLRQERICSGQCNWYRIYRQHTEGASRWRKRQMWEVSKCGLAEDRFGWVWATWFAFSLFPPVYDVGFLHPLVLCLSAVSGPWRSSLLHLSGPDFSGKNAAVVDDAVARGCCKVLWFL